MTKAKLTRAEQLARHRKIFLLARERDVSLGEAEQLLAREEWLAAQERLKATRAWTPDLVGGGAGVELFPSGRFALGSRLLFPRWIGWKGGGRGTQFLILPGHTGPYAFQFDSDPGKVLNGPAPDLPPAMFNQRLEGFDINCNGVALTSIIYAPSWNEKSGLRDVMARNCACQFLRVDEWHGGSAGFGIDDLEVFFTEAAHDANVTGISLAGITRANTAILNRPQVTIRNMTLIGGKIGGDIVDGENGFNAIEIDNAKVQLNGGIHFERCRTGISVKRTLAARSSITPADSAHGHAVSAPTIAAKSAVAPASAVHGHEASQPSVGVAGTVSPASALHGHAATSPALAARTSVVVASGGHGHLTTSPILAARSIVVPASAFHGHAATMPLVKPPSSEGGMYVGAMSGAELFVGTEGAADLYVGAGSFF